MLDVLGQQLACKLRFGPRPRLAICLPVRLVVHIAADPVVFDVPQQIESPAHQGPGAYRGLRPGLQTLQGFAPSAEPRVRERTAIGPATRRRPCALPRARALSSIPSTE